MQWVAGLYGRISTDHEEQHESILVQREALIKYAQDNGFEINGYYFDEGYSGTSYERPQIIRLKKDILNGSINVVVVKDLSRLGRNNPLTLLFLEYLSENGIRLVSINDGYDSFKDEDDYIGIKTWFNERYSKELSHKIKFALKHKKSKGEYLAAFAPYGYRKSKTEKNKLEIDPYAALIVKEIFNLYIKGYGFLGIANILQERGVLNPSSYNSYSKVSKNWDWTTIKRIIKNRVYLGHSIQNKSKKKSYKSKTLISVPQKDWIVVKNTHEAIIDEETFNTCQNILSSRKTKGNYRCGAAGPHLFSSYLFCHDCGKHMYYKNIKGKGYYRSGGYVKYGRSYCTSHQVSEEELVNILASELKKLMDENISINDLVDEIYKGMNIDAGWSDELVAIEEELKKNRIKIDIMYRDRLEGIIDGRSFERLSGEYSKIIFKLEEIKNQLIVKIISEKNDEEVKIQLLNEIKALLNLDSFDRELIEFILKRMEICEEEILIEFNFEKP
ncbi:hypothetical protein OXPF_40170 [Oxobacter pfennigii]|uniref:Recombinase n=1 Tax=Oxobacter pfennigii TaxID=36849 RepID=A0A0P8W1F1_9CLOT|nr:recombinase family protein [Oxobacter pfennigii]KPU42233.1 hypothetical protein OXPF_40170 [Oxobacter pfennigii]